MNIIIYEYIRICFYTLIHAEYYTYIPNIHRKIRKVCKKYIGINLHDIKQENKAEITCQH